MDVALFIFIVILTLAFDYINGFHDAANAIATVVSTKVLSPRVAVIYGASLNLVGALLGTKVAATIGKGIVNPDAVTPEVLIFALMGAIIWNLITWILGLPTSSSHALIGALCGAMFFVTGDSVFSGGLENIHLDKLLHKVIMPMFASPLLGFCLGYALMMSLIWSIHKFAVNLINKIFGKLQIVSAGFMAITHGMNDAQKSMGIIALTVTTFFHTPFEVALWIKLSCALAMGLGTLSGGWKIIRTMGTKMIKLQPVHGFAAETSGGIIIYLASQLGIPISTTQIISSSIMGVGTSKRFSAVKWGIVGHIVWAWVLTLPLTFLLSGVLYWVYKLIQSFFS